MNLARRFRVCLVACITAGLILAAIVFSVIRASLPYATGYRQEIEQTLGEKIGLPLQIGRIDADMHWFSPRLKLLDVLIHNPQGSGELLHFRELILELDLVDSLLRGELTIGAVSLVGVNLSIERHGENSWTVQGIDIDNGESSGIPEQFLYVLNHANYALLESNIRYRDFTGDQLELNLNEVNIMVENSLFSHRLELGMRLLENYGESLQIVAEIEGDIEDARGGFFYIDGKGIVFEQWNKKFSLLPDQPVSGEFDVIVWGRINDKKVDHVETRLFAEDFRLGKRGQRDAEPAFALDELAFEARLERKDQWWWFNLKDLTMKKSGEDFWPHPLNLAMAYRAARSQPYFRLSADYGRLQDLIRVAQALDFAPGETGRLLRQAGIAGEVYNAYIELSADGMSFDGEVMDLAFSLPRRTDEGFGLAIDGLDAAFRGQGDRLSLELLAEQVDIDLEGLFRTPLHADRMRGEVTVAFENGIESLSNWVIRSPRLHIANAHIDTYTRLSVATTPREGGTAVPFLDVQTNFFNARTEHLSTYLPAGIMSGELVKWLDESISGGFVEQGKFMLYGAADRFPYRQNDGVMEVVFSPVDVGLRFLPEWPPLSSLSADIRFYNQSMHIGNGRGNIGKGYLPSVSVDIDDLEKPVVAIQARSVSSIAALENYIWRSPLRDNPGAALRLFEISGEAILDLSLTVPVHLDRIEPSFVGDLQISQAGWRYPPLNYRIDNIHGLFHFSNDDLRADDVQGTIDGRPVTLRVGKKLDDAFSGIEYRLTGRLGIDRLLGIYRLLPENWLSGDSFWRITVAVPGEPDGVLARIDAHSDLRGVKVQVSDTVNKDAAAALPLDVGIDVLGEGEVKLALRADEVLSVNSTRQPDGQYDFEVNAPLIRGQGRFMEGLPVDSTISLSLQEVDLYRLLFSSENEKQGRSIEPTSLPGFDWKIKTLKWKNLTFRDIGLSTQPHQHGILIRRLALTGNDLSLNAKGTWLTSWRYRNETVFSGKLSSGNIGNMLAALGFERSIDRSRLDLDFNLSWRAEPYAVDRKNLKGRLDFTMKDGEILDARPGTGGRILGLLNVFKLPNRLKLDFDDVYRKGFSFDSISGVFSTSLGEGKLTKFDVIAPAADMNMFGSIDLVREDYDLLLRVKPHSDGITFAGGALLGGVAVGAGLALIQKILNIDLISHDLYTIKGAWSDPVIEKIIDDDEDDMAEDDDGF